MFKAHRFANTISRVVIVRKNSVRFISFLKMKEALKRLLGTDSNRLPYEHICQIGDPVLRNRAIAIEPETIKLADFQKIIKHLISVMRSYGMYGLAGPQIGLPWQIFAVEFTNKHMKTTDETLRRICEMEIVPMQVFINPQIKITDHTPIAFHEMCESVRGFSAVVPRAHEIEITALNASAEQFIWRARGWPARIAQHEYDHLQGTLYVDKMDISTFHCTAWEKINTNRGKVQLRYWPRN